MIILPLEIIVKTIKIRSQVAINSNFPLKHVMYCSHIWIKKKIAEGLKHQIQAATDSSSLQVLLAGNRQLPNQ